LEQGVFVSYLPQETKEILEVPTQAGTRVGGVQMH
jgi:hypothetical protein